MRQLRKFSHLEVYKVAAKDGELGKLGQLYLDDQTWSVRYMVVNAGKWILGRDVLVLPEFIDDIDDSESVINVCQTRRHVMGSPHLDLQLPITRHDEMEYYKYYKCTPYWIDDPLFDNTADTLSSEKPGSPYLHSSEEMIGYDIEVVDGEIGRVKDLIIDDHDWMVRYLEIDTGKWLPGKKVLISMPWVESVDWLAQKIIVDSSRELVASAPEYDPSKIISRDYEITLYKHYGKPYR